MVLETSVLSIFNQLTRLEARENFIKLKIVGNVSTLPKVKAKAAVWLQVTRVNCPFRKSRQVVKELAQPKTLPLKGQVVTIFALLSKTRSEC
jgi:hypothetical protein